MLLPPVFFVLRGDLVGEKEDDMEDRRGDLVGEDEDDRGDFGGNDETLLCCCMA